MDKHILAVPLEFMISNVQAIFTICTLCCKGKLIVNSLRSEWIMKVTKEELIEHLIEHNPIGVVMINNVLYEVKLSHDHSISTTGTVWNWDEVSVPSSHGDYQIITDQLVKEYNPNAQLPTQNYFEYYPSINNFLEQ